MPYTRRPFPKPEPQPPKPPASTSAINKYKKALAAWRVERDDWEDSECTYAEGVTAREALQQLSAPEVDDDDEEEEKPAKRGSRNRSGTAVPSGKALGKQRDVAVGEAPSKRPSKAGSGSVGPSGQEKMEARGPQVEAQVRGQSERVRCTS
jgi:hypothetical protein